MAEITFILGGARSGKSSYALSLAEHCEGEVLYLATGRPCDEEMEERIKQHKESRPKSWRTIEEPLNIEIVLRDLEESVGFVILDCLSFWISNLLLHYEGKGERQNRLEEIILDHVSKIISIFKAAKAKVIVVSNEVGMGVVPPTQLGRIFRDVLGRANQAVADCANEVFLVVAGLTIRIR